MIAHLRGSIEFVGKDHLIVNVGNVGLRVYVPVATHDAAGIGKIVDLFTHLHIRENEWTLYGFPSQEELDLFELLIGVSGVGARTALAVLGAASPEQLRSAIAHEQAEVLTRVPGIGPKTASRLAFYLLRAPEEVSGQLAEALTDLKTKIVFCQDCFNITSAGRERCEICESGLRDGATICVVEEPLDVLALPAEKRQWILEQVK